MTIRHGTPPAAEPHARGDLPPIAASFAAAPLPAVEGVDLSLPLRFGHRGYRTRAPENSLAAFTALLSTDAPGVELDIQTSADGELVVCHDFTLARTAGIDVRIGETEWARLSRYSVGAWFGPEFTDERLPRLHDLFALAGKKLYYDIELKEQRTSNRLLVEKLADLLTAFDLGAHCIVSSFNPLVLREFGRVCPAIPRAAIYSRHNDVPWYLRSGLGLAVAGALIAKPHFPIALKNLASHRPGPHLGAAANPALPPAKLAGRLVMPWTVNDLATAAELAAGGAWAIISDDPDGIRTTRDARD